MKGLKGLGGKLQDEGNNQKKTEEFRTTLAPFNGNSPRSALELTELGTPSPGHFQSLW